MPASNDVHIPEWPGCVGLAPHGRGAHVDTCDVTCPASHFDAAVNATSMVFMGTFKRLQAFRDSFDHLHAEEAFLALARVMTCLLYTSDAADE